MHGVDIVAAPGEAIGVVGESGSGKSLTMLAIMRLLAPPLVVNRGTVRFDGLDLTGLPEQRMRELRGDRLAMVYQDPMTTLNPLMRIGDQITEAMTAHGVPKGEARAADHRAAGPGGAAGPGAHRPRLPARVLRVACDSVPSSPWRSR